MKKRARTPRQEFYLRLARLLWYDLIDGNVKKLFAHPELMRLMKLAKCETEDL